MIKDISFGIIVLGFDPALPLTSWCGPGVIVVVFLSLSFVMWKMGRITFQTVEWYVEKDHVCCALGTLKSRKN